MTGHIVELNSVPAKQLIRLTIQGWTKLIQIDMFGIYYWQVVILATQTCLNGLDHALVAQLLKQVNLCVTPVVKSFRKLLINMLGRHPNFAPSFLYGLKFSPLCH